MKFVIHTHSGLPKQPDHYDFMLEHATTLMTWRIAARDLDKLLKGDTITAMRIHDHRKTYLDYEGPISCDRGRVDIFDSGWYALLENSTQDMLLEIKGSICQGILSIKNQGEFSIFFMQGC